jgi:zinc/manganese transport system substrate-binding protein/manganese/iron transport system substrate-binding protein
MYPFVKPRLGCAIVRTASACSSPIPRQWRLRSLVLSLAPLLFLLAACGSTDKRADDFPEIKNPPTVAPGQKVNLVATTTQVADFARVVGGDRVTVIDLVKPGTDAHEYEPTPQDAQHVAQADLIAINGVGLEAYLGNLLEQAGSDRPVAVLSRGIKTRKGAGDEQKAGDPHVWLNPLNVKTMVDNLAAALSAVDPAGADSYRANAAAYKQQLDALDTSIQEQINTIPRDRRKVVTTHDAFGYYIDRYGLTYVGSVIPSTDTNAQPSAKQVADIVRTIKQERVPAIFIESSLNPKLEEQIAQDAGVKVVGTLYTDSLGEPGSAAATYLGMMQANTTAIVDGLR